MPIMLDEEDVATLPAKEAVVARILWVLASIINGQLGPTGAVTHSIEICPMTRAGVLVPRDASNNSTVKSITVPDVFAMMDRCPEYKLHIESGFNAINAVKAILQKDAEEAEAKRLAEQENQTPPA